MRTTEQLKATCSNHGQETWIEAVSKQVSSLRFGLVQIVVHNGRVVQIEKTEKIRFDQTDEH